MNTNDKKCVCNSAYPSASISNWRIPSRRTHGHYNNVVRLSEWRTHVWSGRKMPRNAKCQARAGVAEYARALTQHSSAVRSLTCIRRHSKWTCESWVGWWISWLTGLTNRAHVFCSFHCRRFLCVCILHGDVFVSMCVRVCWKKLCNAAAKCSFFALGVFRVCRLHTGESTWKLWGMAFLFVYGTLCVLNMHLI